MARHAGVGTYIRQLLPRVVSRLPDAAFTVVARPREDLAAWMPAEPGWAERVRVVRASSDIYSLRQHWELGALTRRERPDLWWVPHYDVPRFLGAPFVATVHDVAHLALGEMYGGPLRTSYARLMFGRVRRHARRIIFVSRFTQTEFVRLVGEPSSEHAVIHSGVDDVWSAPAAEPESPLDRPYLLFLGSVKPHKNLSSLLAAFEQISAEIPHHLVIVGANAGLRTGDALAARIPPSLVGRVRITGSVDESLLHRYMAHATALVLPSLYEGFGLPPLEAMAAGCACIVSAAASLPEVCGPAAVYCDPHDPADIARQIRRVIADSGLHERLVAAGREHARRFRWQTAAEKTAAVLASALDPASSPE